MKKYVAYYRVSTDKQGKSRLGLEAQTEAVNRFVAARDKVIAEFTEVESGKKNNRPELQKALQLCSSKNAVLIIAKLDRLARNVHFISGLMESGVEFTAVDFPEANRLTIHILAAVAEHEREMISTRTKDAMRAAKARGIRLGSPKAKKLAPRASLANQQAAQNFAASLYSTVSMLREKGQPLREIASWLNQHGIKTRRGKRWHANSVKRVLDRNL